MTAEADKRQHNAFADLKDVWRPDLDIQTAIRARVSADQAPRIEALQAELAELQEQNRASEERLHGTEAQIDAVRSNVTSALEMLDKVRIPKLTLSCWSVCLSMLPKMSRHCAPCWMRCSLSWVPCSGNRLRPSTLLVDHVIPAGLAGAGAVVCRLVVRATQRVSVGCDPSILFGSDACACTGTGIGGTGHTGHTCG